MELAGKTILITGAGRGIGAAMARRLAGAGADLALVDLHADPLDAVAAQCGESGVTVRRYLANVSDETQIESVYDAACRDFQRLDGSIANAGIVRDGLLVKAKGAEVLGTLSLADWQAVIDVNLTGVFLCGRAAAANMIRLGTGGCIINISSISRAGNFGQSNYSASKAGVAALTAVWAKELARHGVRVNAIAPGFVRTEILNEMKPEVLEKMTAQIPVGRMGEPDEIARTAQFVLENEYVNGRIVEVDGGQRL